MSDLFVINSQTDDSWKKSVDEYKQSQKEETEKKPDPWAKSVAEYQEKKHEHYNNMMRYGVEVPDEYYDVFGQILSKYDTKEEAQEEAFRIGSAVKYSELFDEPLLDSYKNVDSYNKANFPSLQNQKGFFEALGDMITLGNNNVKLGLLGQKLKKAHSEHDTELENDLMEEIDVINQRNAGLQDHIPDRWWKELVEAGGASIPFTGYTAGAGLIGNFILPGSGIAASMAVASELTAGQEYLYLIANGTLPSTARKVSNVSGILQGAIESNYGLTKSLVKSTAKVIGKELAESAADRAVKEIGKKLFKRFHFGPSKKLLLNFIYQYGKNVIGEGAEEAAQNIVSTVGKDVAAILDDYDLPYDDVQTIVNETMEQFRGGMLGAVFLGVGPAGLNALADVKKYQDLKKDAEKIESEEVLYNKYKDSKLFDGVKEENKRGTIHDIFEAAQLRKEEEARAEAQNYAETLDAGEGAEERAVNEEGEEVEAEPVYRTENGKLDIQDDEHLNDDGTVTGTFVVGDSSKKDNNRYGYITYSADEENKTVTIDTFKMTEGREGLRGEFYDEFAQKYAGYDIKWNPNKSESQNIKETLIENNPSGKKAGLNYYSENDIVDFGSRKEAAKIIGETFHNIEERNGELIQTPLSKEQIATGVAFLELGAKLSEETLTDFMNKNFNNRQFIGPQSELIESAIKNNISPEKVYGGFEWKNFGKDLKAVIYAGQNADFDTFIHECTHMFQSLLTGDLKEEAERLFNVQEGDWRNSTYVLPDGRKMSSAEAFVEMYQDWVIRKKAPSQEHENIFKKLAQFIVDAYTRMKEHFTLTPEIENLFDKLLAEDDGAYAKALKAVEENDREYKATLKRKAEEENNARKAKAEEAKRTQEAEREEVSETTDFVEKLQETTLEQAEKQLNEVTNEEKTTGESNEIDNAVENLDLTDEEKTEITDTLKNEDATVIEKSEAVTEAAESVYAENDEEIPPDMFYKDLTDPKLLFQGNITDAESKIDNVIQFAKATDNKRVQENYGKVSEALSENAKQHGFDIEGYSHSIDNYFIKHESKRNKNLTDADFKKIPEIINNPDYIIYGSVVKTTGNNAITYVKNGVKSAVFVEEIRNGKKTLAAQSMSKTSRTFNVQSIMTAPELYAHSDPSTIQIVDVKNEIVNNNMLLQTVYHGSPHYFDNFSTENIGTGEGAQAFGWGLYFTNQEAIARFYADKLANEPKRISLIAKNEYLKSRKKSLRDVENKEKYEARIVKNINHFKKELKQAQKAGDESEIKFYEGLIDDSIKQLDEKERLSLVESFKKDIANAEQEIADLKASMKNNRNLYTVDIPDEGYIVWDKPLTSELINKVNEGLKKLESEKKFYSDMEMSAGYNPWNIQYEEYMKAPENFKVEDLYNYLEKVLHSDKAASLFLKDLGYIGIDYPAHSLSGYTSEDERNYVIFDEANINIENHLLFQKAYHGSGADFDKFDTENFGLSGEGSMSFGYGTYFTDSEEIARSYAERQRKQFEKDADNPYERDSLEYEMFEDLRSFDFDKDRYKEYLLKESENIKKDKDNPYQNFKADNKLALLDNINSTNLYTVEIPDNGFILWDEDVDTKTVERVKKAVFKKLTTEPDDDGEYPYKGVERELQEELNDAFDGSLTGQTLYNNVAIYLGSEKNASKLLNKIGFVGIEYPAYSNFGNAMGKTARNFVIFDDEDAKIVGHMFFQTQAELLDEAKSFDSWQDFMDFYEVMGKPEVTPIPYDADAQWYQSFWEMAHGMQTEQEKNEQAMHEKAEKDGSVPLALDAMFATVIKSEPEMLDNFLKTVADIDAIDLGSDEWRTVQDEEGAKERQRIEELKDYINITLSDYNWQTAIKRVQGGHEIAEGLRKRLIGEMTDNYKLRDFRALYSEIMDDAEYAVEQEDSTAAQLSKKLSKYQKRYYDILKPNEDIARVSPERRKRIAEAMQNKDIAAKIKSGKLKLDDELDTYIKSLDRQVKDIQKEYDELEQETKNDYQRIADAERRRLLKLHDELLLARSKMQTRNAEIERKIAKGLKITEKYRRESQNMTANYDELFRKFADLKDSIQITAEVQAALDRQEKIAGLKEELNAKQKDKNNYDEIKKMRIQLVKRTMRRVPFNRIDYENAKTVIAIQRMLEPNLLGGVNRFIGIDSPFLRGVISGIVTDSEYKEKILRYLDKTAKASEAYVNFKKKLMELKSIKDFDSWTAKERKYAIKHLPKENWVRDLDLERLAKEREESIDLDIGMKEIQEPVYDEKTGEIKTYKDNDGIEHNVTRTGFRLEYDEELGQMVKDAVGADMFDRIINKPFSEWTTEELEQLAQRIDELYTEGRDLLAAKNKARKLEAKRIRKNIEDAIKETGITINDDDTPEEKARKQEQIDKILGLNDSNIKGTEAGKTKGIKAKLDRLVHSYNDLNVLRFARILDGQSEGENVRMLYRREDDCFNAKQRSIYNRTSTVKKIMADQKITEGDLAKTIKVSRIGTEFTVDELLYFLAADKDYAEDETKVAKGEMGIDANDNYAPTSRNAVMFGNMMSDAASQEEKELFARLDEEMKEAIENDTLTPEQKEQLAIGQLDKKPGTTRFIARCHAKWEVCIAEAMNFLAEHPEYNALMEAIEADYASQYERLNEISINEFNTPVHRVKCYVPLIRRESNGDTNVNQVKEDLLGAYGAESGKQWVNKGMTKRRQNISPLHQKPVQTGLFRTWVDSIERTEHFIAYSPYVRQLNEVYKSRDAAYTRRFIEARYGKGAVEYLDSYINEVANPNAGKIREKGAELLHTLRGKTAPAYLGWKFSAVVKQALTSPWPYMQFVNPAEYLASCFDCVNGGYEAIKEKSVFMKNRVMNPLIELVDEMQDQAKNKFDRGWSNFTKKGMAGLEWIDWTCVAPGWLACYKKEYNRLQRMSEAAYQAKKEKLTEKNMSADISTSEYLTPEQIEAKAREELMQDIELAAVQYADDCTRQCQPSSRVTDLAPLFKNSSEAMKAFLQFQTSLNVIWQNIRYDLPYAIKQKQFDRVAGAVMGYVFAGIFMNSVMEGLKGDDDDKELQSLRNLIYYATTQFTDAIPIIGSEITNTMDQLITGKRGFYSTGTDMTPSATKLLAALNKARNGNWQKAAALTAEGIGLFMGAPVSGIKEINKLLGKPLEEGDVNLLRGIGDVYGLAGDIIGE